MEIYIPMKTRKRGTGEEKEEGEEERKRTRVSISGATNWGAAGKRPKKTRRIPVRPWEDPTLPKGKVTTGGALVHPADQACMCPNPMPPLTEERDFCGVRIPETTWRRGLIFGGDNIPFLHRFHLESIFKWYTQDCIDRFLLPFVRRDTSSTHEPGSNTAVISLRNLENLLCGINLVDSMEYSMKDAEGKVRSVSVRTLYRDLLRRYHRRSVDTVRRNSHHYDRTKDPDEKRNQRCYVRGSDGVVYPTTVPQLLMLNVCWTNGIIFLGVMLVDYIAVWRDKTRKEHRKAKAKIPGRRIRMTKPHATDARCHMSAQKSLEVIFQDKQQFDIVRKGIPRKERGAFIRTFLREEWMARIEAYWEKEDALADALAEGDLNPTVEMIEVSKKSGEE